MGSYMSRYTSNPITQDGEGDRVLVYSGYGYDIQSSYLFKNDIELIGRFSTIRPESIVKPYFPDQKQFTLGITRYIWEHAFKIQLEASLDQLTFNNGTDENNFYLRFQVEMGI